MNIRIISLIILFAAISCKKNNDQEIVPQPSQTGPFSFSLPLHFSNSKYTIPSDNPMTYEGIALGRMLFYDKSLSSDGTVSCASCHKQKYAFADTSSFSKGVENRLGKRNSMAIFNLVFQDSLFFWDGRVNTLENQVLFPLHDPLEMNMDTADVLAYLNSSELYKKQFQTVFGTATIKSNLVFKAIAQFERSITSTNSKFDQYILGKTSFTDQEKNGYALFRTHPVPERGIRGGNCGDCHNTTNFIEKVANFRNNGLDSEFTDLGRQEITKKTFDAGKFRIPSLRNIAVTAPYMHDGRFKTLEEVLDHYNEHIMKSSTLDPLITAASNQIDGKTLALTAKEKEDIIAFLHTLTDETLLTNEAYSNPFK